MNLHGDAALQFSELVAQGHRDLAVDGKPYPLSDSGGPRSRNDDDPDLTKRQQGPPEAGIASPRILRGVHDL